MRPIIIFLGLFICLESNAQTTDIPCNQKSKYKTKGPLPQEVCIPEDFVVSYIYTPVDVNNDGLNDLILDYNKENLINGDTIFVAIYFQQNDSSFHLAKTLSNLYPISFNEYSYQEYKKLTDPTLKSILSRYNCSYPLTGINFSKGEISIEFKTDAVYSITLFFRYDMKQETWVLKKKETYANGLGETTLTDVNEKEQYPIEDFDYFDWF
jgi:hypothetical protein